MNALTSFRLCKLSSRELIERLDKQTDEMFQTQQVPTRHIPARPDADYDLLVGELIMRFGELEAFINSVEADLSDMINNDKICAEAVNLRRKVSMFLAAEYGKQALPTTPVNFCVRCEKKPKHEESVYCIDCLYERKMSGY